MPAGNNNFVDTDAKIKDFLNAVLSSEGIVVDIRRTFINYNGVNRSRVFARRANEMASKGGNEKFVVIALMCYPALQWILQAQDIDRLVEELREQNPDESVSRMSNIQRVLESSLGGCKPQLRLEMRKVFFARCQQLVDAVDEAMNAAVFHNPKSKAGKISLAMALLRGSILETDPVTAVTIRTHFDSIIEDVAAMAGDTIKPLVMQLAPNEGNAESSEAAFLFHNTEVLLKEYSRIAYVLRPSDSYNQLDLVVEGLAFTSDDGLTQTFTAPYDGDYIITAYGANGGTGKGKYQGYRTPGRGGKAEGTIHLSAGQTIHIYLGEAGGYWSTNRTFGGGGGQIDWDRAWFPDEDNGQTDRYHVFGRGGGATYVTVDAWTMDQAGEAAHDYTDAEKAQNDAAAEVAKNHVILLAGGGGGMGESGGTAGGGGLEGQGPVANRYYAGGFPPYSNAFSYDATVGGTTPTNGRVLTYDERVDAKVYPATQTRAGFGYHYTILGELYDANPANRDPVSLLFDDGQARNYGSFFYGANGITCSGAGGGGWFGGGTDYAFSGGGGSSFVNTSVTIDGKQVEVKDADYEVGGNMKYDSTNSAPYLINGRVLIHMVGTTPKMKTIMMEAQNEDISSSHVDDADVYGQKAYLNKGQDVASTTIAYTAITYYNMGDLMTVNPVWEYSTMLSPTDRDWNDSVAKSIDSRLSVSVANTNLGVPNPGDKYYNADYPGWYAVKSVMTITNPVNTMYSTERLTKYYFRCKGIASYTLSSGTKTMYDKGERGELAIDYNIYINHEGVHVYSDRNIINGTPTSTVDDTIAATAGRSASTWQYPHMALTDVNNINTILIQFSSHGFNTSDSISYDASYADSLGITGSGNQYSYIFKAKSKNSVSTANWEKFLQSITYTTYDAATFTSTGVSGGVTIFWYADENLWENNMFYDSSSGHFYACINTGNSITWGEARNRALSMYNSALDCYGYLAHITSQSEQDYLYTLMDKSTQGWLGATRKVSGNEWDWYWRDGPANETSEPFFRQNADGTYGTLLWGYENWDSKTEPNNSGGVEWCMHYYGSNRGVWNDYIDSNGAVTSFIVEWSKDGLVGNDHSVSDTDVIGTQIVAEQEQKVNNGEVSGTVWAENDYNGLFATDEAKLQDITVQLISDDGTVVATAQTNKLGQYDFTGLAPGNYYVKFTSQSFVGYNAVPDGGNSIVQQASKGINDSYAQTPVFALTYNDVLEKSFGVYVPSTVSGFAWDDANQNGIYDNREAKIANVTITLTDADGNSLTDVYGNPIAAVLTDANGNYSFTNVRPRKEMKLTLTSSNTVDISNARVSPIPASGDVKLTNKAEKSIGMLEFNGAPTSATTEKSGSMLTSATIGEIYINSMSGTGITPVNAEYKNFALSANNSIRGYVWVESDYNGILDGWHETQADIDIEEPVLNGVKVTLKILTMPLSAKRITGLTSSQICRNTSMTELWLSTACRKSRRMDMQERSRRVLTDTRLLSRMTTHRQ